MRREEEVKDFPPTSPTKPIALSSRSLSKRGLGQYSVNSSCNGPDWPTERYPRQSRLRRYVVVHDHDDFKQHKKDPTRDIVDTTLVTAAYKPALLSSSSSTTTNNNNYTGKKIRQNLSNHPTKSRIKQYPETVASALTMPTRRSSVFTSLSKFHDRIRISVTTISTNLSSLDPIIDQSTTSRGNYSSSIASSSWDDDDDDNEEDDEVHKQSIKSHSGWKLGAFPSTSASGTSESGLSGSGLSGSGENITVTTGSHKARRMSSSFSSIDEMELTTQERLRRQAHIAAKTTTTATPLNGTSQAINLPSPLLDDNHGIATTIISTPATKGPIVSASKPQALPLPLEEDHYHDHGHLSINHRSQAICLPLPLEEEDKQQLEKDDRVVVNSTNPEIKSRYVTQRYEEYLNQLWRSNNTIAIATNPTILIDEAMKLLDHSSNIGAASTRWAEPTYGRSYLTR